MEVKEEKPLELKVSPKGTLVYVEKDEAYEKSMQESYEFLKMVADEVNKKGSL